MFIGYVTNKKRWCGEDFKGMSRLYLKKYNLEKHYTYRSQCNKWIICFTVASNLDSIPEMDNEISSNYSLSKATNLLNKMLSNRQFEDILGIAKSTRMKLNNGVTLCCLRFCIASTLWTCRRQNQESSDKLITEQYTETEIIEKILEEDLSKLTNYFHVWRLQRYIMANKELRLHSRNCKQHILNTIAKLRTRNNILQKICGISCWSSASTLPSTLLQSGLIAATQRKWMLN